MSERTAPYNRAASAERLRSVCRYVLNEKVREERLSVEDIPFRFGDFDGRDVALNATLHCG